ncbi:c-type cytochrome [Ruegeria arenilitoris]|uniref:c-type cytochrome n=1 Tax=Ruegeria arenilitoris TaxID=1173585 RepID=UPI00147C29B1|nr:c-type cytochrome [Ruegeria arenilitoris]
MKCINLFMCGCVLGLPGWAALAGENVEAGQDSETQPDLELGAYLSAQCVTCHQKGSENEGIPNIAGLSSKDFVAAMQAYKQNDRAHPIMQMLAARLNDDEIAALAAYFGSVE